MPFTFKPFAEMADEDYQSIGLKCGLEVHQQLLTERKLFCHCPAGCYGETYDAEILRHMRPTLSELGEYDGTALMEKKTRKNIFYRIHHETVCTYEFDDTPPFLVDPIAVDIAIEISLLLHLNLVGELHIARKQYLDGSIPTGFQRTGLVSVGGWMPYRDRRIGITQLSLEEDSCREVSDVGHERIYNTDRLGMPLIEVVTDPDMRTPREMSEVCQIIRRLCRSTRKVRTGYGAAREDVNVSVRGGTRIEIKGVPQIPRIPHLVYNEARRQCSLLAIRDELHARGIREDNLETSVHDVSRVLAKAHFEPLRFALAAGHHARAVVLKGFAGLLNHPIQEHTSFATEFSDRVRVIACLTRLPNIVHSDSAAMALSARDWKALARKTKAGPNDATVIVWGDERDTQTAAEEIIIRASEATIGVPSDTRQAHLDGTTGFERVLPGPERMYPDTDLPPAPITRERVLRIQAQLPEPVWEREARFVAVGLSPELAVEVNASAYVDAFDDITRLLPVPARFVAVVLCHRFKSFTRKGLAPQRLTDEAIYVVFEAFSRGKLAREGVIKLFRTVLEQHDRSELVDLREIEQSITNCGLTPLKDEELDALVDAELAQVNGAIYATPEQRHRHLMGLLMQTVRGRTEGQRLSERLLARLQVQA